MGSDVMKWPNFFIVGAPKCGTSTMYDQLRHHPDIFMCEPKEPNYFATDFPEYRYLTEWPDYEMLFERAGPCAAVGESSAIYLYSRDAIPALLQRIPTARLIVMLRNPVDMAISMHAQAVYDQDEDIVSFEDAWRKCEERRDGRHIPPHCRNRDILLYDQITLLGAQLKRVMGLAKPENVMCLFLDDLVAQPVVSYRRVLDFLDVRDDGRTVFPRLNARKTARSRHLGLFLKQIGHISDRPPSWLFHARRRLGLERLGIRGWLERQNSGPSEAAVLSPSLRDALRAGFAEDIRTLGSLTGRNLEGWLAPDSAEAA
jgi:hypothetical protein